MIQIKNTTSLSDNELLSLCDIMNGHWWDEHSPKDEILPSLGDTLAGIGMVDDFEKKWGVNGDSLFQKIQAMTEEESQVLKKNIIGFWLDK